LGDVTRSLDAAEKLVVAIGLTITAGWYAFVVWLIFGTVSALAGRLVSMAVAAVFTGIFVLLLRSAWRSSLTSPLPSGRANSWIVRQPWWILTVVWFVAFGAPGATITAWAVLSGRPSVPGLWLASWLGTAVLGSSYLTLVLRVNWRLRAERSGTDRSAVRPRS
jgi:hypothetical protein